MAGFYYYTYCMKKISSVFVPFFMLAVFLLSGSVVHAAADLPATAVWFTPATATVGSPVVLNALVYNNQTISATVTVAFETSTPTVTIGTITASIPAETAKTLSYNWKMPSASTVITATVTKAVGSNGQSIPALLGTLGTTSVASTPTPLLSNLNIPGTSAISAWFATTFANVEAFRNKEAVVFSAQRDALKSTMGANTTNAFGNPSNYLLLIYSSTAASLFSSIGLFYIVLLLAVLLLLKFIVNLIF
jgi:hypothetical protein